MRRSRAQSTGETLLLGDRDLAAFLAAALAHAEPVDRATHGFHTWPAGLHPDAARDLVARFPGGAVLDPFCGGGTVLVEARIAGRRAVGRDLSPIATRIAAARASTADEAALSRMRAVARRLTEAARHAGDPPPEPILRAVRDWYAPHVLCELEAIRRGVVAVDEPEVRGLLETVFSSLLVKVSWRESDTSAKRVKHHRPPGTAAILFHKKARELGRRVAALRELVPPGTPPADVATGDARAIALAAPVELVLTSPPYPSTYDYLPMQHLRRVWLGLVGDDDAEIGARRQWRGGERDARRRWRADTDAWTHAVAGVMAPGGTLVVVIGDGFTPNGVVDTAAPTDAAARAAGLVPLARASLERPDFARGTTRWEHIFAFRRP